LIISETKKEMARKSKKECFLFGKLRENIGIFASPQRYLRDAKDPVSSAYRNN